MNIDSREIQQVAASDANPGGHPNERRFDMYAGIHKAMRAMMADTLMAVGRMDTDDDLETAETTHRVLELMEFCASHLRHENEFVHGAIEARAAGASAVIAREHDEHEKQIHLLAQSATALLHLGAADRCSAAQKLYRDLTLFIAHNFEHMYIEETAHNAVLWSRYTDAELMDIEGRLVASIPPAEMMYTLRWLIPFMNPAERLAMLSGMKHNAPPPAFEAALDVVRPHLTEREWAKLARGLGVPVAPGLLLV